MDQYADALGIAAPAPPAPKAPASGKMDNRAFVGGRDDLVNTLSSLQSTLADAKEGSALYQRTATDIQGVQAELKRMGVSAAPAAAAPKADPYADALGIGGPAQPAPAAAPAVAAAPKPAGVVGFNEEQFKQGQRGIRDVLANQVTGIGSSIVGGYKGLASLLTGGTMDDAANEVRDYQDAHTYQGNPDAISGFASPGNPVNWPGLIADKAGGAVTDMTGSPAAGTAVNTGINAGALALGLRGRPGTAPVEVGPARPATGVYRPLGGTPATALPAPGEPQTVPQQTPPGAPPVPVRTNPEPAQPLPQTAEAIQAVAKSAPAKLFPETPTTAPAGKFSPQEQTARAKILESVGIDTNKLRKSAISGDGTGGSTDFQTAKLDSPAGREMKAIIEGEKVALTNHAESLVGDTGGTHGVDQSALYARGNTIIAPLDGLKQWFDQKTSALYKTADERAAGVPTTLENFKGILNDSSELTNSDRVHLQSAVNAYIKKLGMAGEDGSIAGSAKQAETIRKYLNEQWSPANSKLVGKLKDALDEDVTATAGDDIYAEARKIRTLRGQTLDNPNGIAKLMDSSGPEGINRAVPVEKIADSLTGMPVDQFSHVIKTLREAPPELAPQSQAALAEIKAQFANKVHAIGSAQQGQWNAKGVTKYLQNNAARMAEVFTPEELAKFRNLNDAGHIVAKDQSYPGAAVQGHNLVTQGTMHALPTAGAAAGGFIGGPVGAAVGAAAGRMAAGAVDNAATMRAVKKRTTKLSDLLETK
jgi:hypothetical protein